MRIGVCGLVAFGWDERDEGAIFWRWAGNGWLGRIWVRTEAYFKGCQGGGQKTEILNLSCGWSTFGRPTCQPGMGGRHGVSMDTPYS
jgi:hypothetical protein